MQSCLGVYVEDNLIKYAKVTKDKDNIKIEAFGTKFYEDLSGAIKQVVKETNSSKGQISVNLDDEIYNYFDLFALLNKKDLNKSAEIEFEMLCKERNIKKEDMERRHIFVLDQEQANRMKAINVSVEKRNLEQRKSLFDGMNLTCITPLPIGITNLIKASEDENALIVNMEERTTLTFLEQGQVHSVDEIETSITEALRTISKKENSDTKAYEILKNITISSQDVDGADGNEYMDIVVPILFKMLNEIKEKMAEFKKQIHRVYFTGTGIVINNLDMYFQDRFNDIQCEMVKPSFLDTQSLKIGIKDYIEVNSAISLALSGMGTGNANDLNFSGKNASGKVGGIELGGFKGPGGQVKVKSLSETANQSLDAFEKTVMRLLVLVLVFFMGYLMTQNKIFLGLEEKEKNIDAKIVQTQQAQESMIKTISSIDALTTEYNSVVQKLTNTSINEGAETFGNRELQNFLTQLAGTIPREVKLISLENTTERHIVIQARAIKYQQLGYFKAILEANGILENVSASTGIRTTSAIEGTVYENITGRTEEYIVITIEGDLINQVG